MEALGVGSGTVFFPELKRKAEALLFDYNGQWKARAIEEKAFVSEKGFKLAFWNIGQVLAGNSEEVWITEGELDACALVEAGVPADAVMSVPNGAKARDSNSAEELRGYEYVEHALGNGLGEKIKRFIWCGDSDEAGLSLRSDMARLIGAARYHFVEWPEKCKDANEVLLRKGGSYLQDLVCSNYLQWPVPGLYRMSQLPEPPPLTTWSTGFFEWNNKIMLAPRTLSVVTGQPGHGKTLLFGQIFFQIVRRYSLIACVASFETRPKPHIRRQLRSLHALAEGEQLTLERDLDEKRKKAADDFIEDHYRFMVHPDQRPTLGWFLDAAEVAVVREGARIIQLDPWNRLEAGRDSREMETEYIARSLRELHSFANDLNCHVQIIAHPAKLEGKRRSWPPELEDIAGSKAWDAMADQGFTVFRAKTHEGTKRVTKAELYHRKARFEELGYRCSVKLNYRLDTGAYEIDNKEPDQPEKG